MVSAQHNDSWEGTHAMWECLPTWMSKEILLPSRKSCQIPLFASKIRLREEAAKAFHEEHAKDVWRRAVAYRHRPMRGPYVQGQLVYMFRAAGRGQLSTRHGKWLGPAKVIGVESSSNSPIPRLVWTSYNGYLYRCRPEGLHPMSEDETEFRALARELALYRPAGTGNGSCR